jgi:hypothetical protein
MVADMSTDGKETDLIWKFLFAYGRSSIPYNLVIPGDNSKKPIELPTTFASPAPVLKGLELAR